ncbi:hypothetical protein AK812_SmicGene1215 [Symbiodinium microadriaticum]|uniref:Uncharacterized protein n=1 Tax=Symbiodinium microadriaticum TaxID=2951 RepID=A0A1Q9F4T1_SYMMI|nr:hypothetical protein AK812_SmicGene1215 [Symbiodinium microadriaticum]
MRGWAERGGSVMKRGAGSWAQAGTRRAGRPAEAVPARQAPRPPVPALGGSSSERSRSVGLLMPCHLMCFPASENCLWFASIGASRLMADRSPGTESAVTVSLGAAVRPPGVPQDGWRERPIADPHGGVSLVLQRSTALARESPARMRPAVQRDESEAWLPRPTFWHIAILSTIVVAMMLLQTWLLKHELSYDERNQLLADAASVVARVNMEQGLKLNWTA